MPQINMQLKNIFKSSHMMELQLSLILLSWLISLLDHNMIKQLNCSVSIMITFVFCELTIYTTIRKNSIYRALVF